MKNFLFLITQIMFHVSFLNSSFPSNLPKRRWPKLTKHIEVYNLSAYFSQFNALERIWHYARLHGTQLILCIPGRASLCLDFNISEHPEKTVSGYGVSTFNFLGFTYYCGKTRKGTFRVGLKTNPKKIRAKRKAMNQWLKSIRNPALYFAEPGDLPSYAMSVHQRRWWIRRKRQCLNPPSVNRNIVNIFSKN